MKGLESCQLQTLGVVVKALKLLSVTNKGTSAHASSAFSVSRKSAGIGFPSLP